MKIQITSLSRKTTEDELRDLFSVHGKVDSVTIVMDKVTGTSKGFGFIEMPHEKDAKVAVTKLHKYKLGGEKISVKAVK